jgi:hypothetical protein
MNGFFGVPTNSRLRYTCSKKPRTESTAPRSRGPGTAPCGKRASPVGAALATTIGAAIMASLDFWRFAARESSSAKGMKNCESISTTATHCHPPALRCKYHEISFGRLPDQITGIAKTRRRSRRSRTREASAQGRERLSLVGSQRTAYIPCPERKASRAVTRASADRKCPAIKIMAKMVEYHSGSSDITQSVEAKFMQST